VGLRGLMVAALLSAAMSTLSSVFNMLSMLTTPGMSAAYATRFKHPLSARGRVVMAKGLTVAWGVLVMAAALSMIRIESILKTVNTTISIFTAPMTGIFLLGLFSRKANARGVIIGFALSFAAGLILQYGTKVTFTFYSTVELAIMLTVGSLASRCFAAPEQSRIEPLLWRWRGWREMLFSSDESSPKEKASERA